VSLKVGDVGDKAEEVTFNKLFLQDPEFISVVIDDSVLVWVSVNNKGTGGSSEEVGEEIC